MEDININNDCKDMLHLTPFKACVLQNFPFIESDFDAVTNYQLLCKVVEYLNKVIDNSNKQNDNITQLQQNFITLYNYVKDYFDNLDVQDEINKKIDDMVASGAFTLLFSGIYTPEMFGAKGDGVTDDTLALQKALAFNNTCLTKNYLVSEALVLNSNSNVFGGGTITLKKEFSDSYLKHFVFYSNGSKNIRVSGITINSNSLGFSLNGVMDVTIENITLTTDKYAILVTDSTDNESSNITISNVNINNNVSIGSSDGIHINGGCKNIDIINVIGTTGDDFIALNSIEGIRHSISNVNISNIICSGYAGIRIYGGAKCAIENVTIYNSQILSENGLRFTNIVGFTDISFNEPIFKNIVIKNCNVNSSVRPVFISYVNSDIKIYDSDLNTSSTNPVIGYFNGSINSRIEFYNCSMSTNSNSYIQDCVLSPVPDNCNANVSISFENMTVDKQLIIAFGKYNKNIELRKCIINKYLIGTTAQDSVRLVITDSTINYTPYDGSAKGYYEIRNCILNANVLLSSLNNTSDTTLFIMNIYLNNNKKGTFVNFSGGISENKIINLEGAYQLSTTEQNEGTIIKRYSSNGFDSIQVYKNDKWVAL